MQNFNQKITKLIQKHWLFSYIIIATIFAFVVNIAMNAPIDSFNPSLGANDWLGFWGSYLGGVLACIPALAALIENRREAKQQHEEFQKQLQELEKDRHFSKLPVLNVQATRYTLCHDVPSLLPTVKCVFELNSDGQLISCSKNSVEYMTFVKPAQWKKYYFLDIKNIGFGPAIDTAMYSPDGPPSEIGSFAFGTSETDFTCIVSFENSLSIDDVGNYIEHRIDFTFHDILGWKYTQHINFKLTGAGAVFDPISSPERLNEF